MDFREGLRTLREVAEGTAGKTKAVVKAVATDLVPYEAFDSAIGALMRFYNEKLKGKLDKGAYTGNAQDLKDEIDKKQNKQDNTLETTAKKIVPAINESLWRTEHFDIYNFNSLDEVTQTGFYKNGTNKESFITPDGSKVFTLIVIGVKPYKTQIFKAFNSNIIYTRYMTSYDPIKWGEWVEIMNIDNKLFKGQIGIETIKFIQNAEIKEKDKGYFDEITGKLYRCIKQAPASVITPNLEYFTQIDNLNISLNKKIVQFNADSHSIQLESGWKFCFVSSGFIAPEYGWNNKENEYLANVFFDLTKNCVVSFSIHNNTLSVDYVSASRTLTCRGGANKFKSVIIYYLK